jgi:plasmid stabilization system protein ParE
VKEIRWSARASSDVAALDRTVARRNRGALLRYAETESGDVIRLQDAGQALRLRVGDGRVIFERLPKDQIRALRVLHGSQAYR